MDDFWDEAEKRGLLHHGSFQVVKSGRDLERVILLLEGLDIAAFLGQRGQAVGGAGSHGGGSAKFEEGGIGVCLGVHTRTPRRTHKGGLGCTHEHPAAHTREPACAANPQTPFPKPQALNPEPQTLYFEQV